MISFVLLLLLRSFFPLSFLFGFFSSSLFVFAICMSTLCLYVWENRSEVERKKTGKLYMVNHFLITWDDSHGYNVKKKEEAGSMCSIFEYVFRFMELAMIVLEVLQLNRQFLNDLFQSDVGFLVDDIDEMWINPVHLVEIYWKPLDKDKMDNNY